ncbi:MAG: hypothetical protein ACK4YP_04200 [Myxococcota bacterium]
MLLLALLACTGADTPDDTAPAAIPDDGCVHPRWEAGWPFPSNRLVTRDATSPTGVRLSIDESVLPLSRKDLVPLDVAWLQDLDGFSRLAPAVVQLDAPVDPASFPALSEDGSAPIALLDVEAAAFVPGRLSVTADGSTLTVWPDVALRPGALHAIVLRSDLPTDSCFSAGPAILEVERGDDAQAAEMAAARAAAVTAGLSAQDVAAVVPFTTRSSEREFATMRAIEAAAPDLVDPSDLVLDEVIDCAAAEDAWCAEGIGFVVRGTASLPTWQGADRVFETDADGVPTVQGAEEVGFWLLVPEAARAAPAPLLVLQHGLGGDRESLVGFGAKVVAAGHAVVAIDAVAHGDRPHEDDVTLTFFGIDFERWLVAAARDNIRQTAADHLALRALLAEATAADGAFAGQAFHLAPDDATYVGQSLGGIIGSTTCATDTGLDQCVLNVPGGRLVEVVRANPAYAALMNIYFDPAEQQGDVELFSAFAQTVVDPADPALNAPRILHEAPARPVLVQEATEDATVANQTTELMARSMGIPLLRPAIEDIRGLDGADMPVADNVVGADGAITAGLAQFVAEHGFLTYDGGEEGDRALRQILGFLAEGRIETGEIGE